MDDDDENDDDGDDDEEEEEEEEDDMMMIMMMMMRRRRRRRMQSLGLPCRISLCKIKIWYQDVRWQHVQSNILKQDHEAKLSRNVSNKCRTKIPGYEKV